jgi:hypothetical protein
MSMMPSPVGWQTQVSSGLPWAGGTLCTTGIGCSETGNHHQQQKREQSHHPGTMLYCTASDGACKSITKSNHDGAIAQSIIHSCNVIHRAHAFFYTRLYPTWLRPYIICSCRRQYFNYSIFFYYYCNDISKGIK